MPTSWRRYRPRGASRQRRRPAPRRSQSGAGVFRRLRESLAKSRQALTEEISASLFDRIDDETWERLEEALILADAGAPTTAAVVERLEHEVEAGTVSADGEAVRDRLIEILAEVASTGRAPIDLSGEPAVLMMVGVNGTGKTTTIGKIAWHLSKEFGLSVVLAAGDTYRAAAAEQLAEWAERAGAELVRSEPGADPGAVAFDAISAARARGADVVIVDTAGRLHTQGNLMDELAKVRRVIAKQIPEAPHETLISIDATTGQNGLRQAKVFSEAVEVDGVVLTKLDGTAKGGITLAIANELGIPVKLIGTGESLEDLRPFDPADFARALLAELTPSKLGAGVRPALRPPPGDPLRGPLARQAERGRRRRGDAGDPPRPARGRRQLQGRQSVHGDAEGALPRLRGAGEPRPRPAGGEDRQRGADGADGRDRARPRLRLQRPDGDPDGRAAGLGQDDRLREARPPPRRVRQNVALAACDVYRPAAVDQLVTVGERAGAHVYQQGADRDPVEIAEWALDHAREEDRDVLIVDTAGRLHIDEDLMAELARIRKRTKPHDVLLVVDAMTGQDAVGVAEAFAEAAEFDGVVMTKLDGDARGGAALSVKAVTGKPIIFASTGEKLEDLDAFYPDRMASRILGMGDVLTLIEKAEQQVDERQAQDLERKLRKESFTLEDFLGELQRRCARWARSAA